MTSPENPHHDLILSNKFYPPHIASSQSLTRVQLLSNQLSQQQNKKAIIIEAQAGQGKTTLAAQFLSHHDLNYVWYQIGQEDSDPVFLLSCLLTNLSTNLEDFSCPKLEQILNQGSVGPFDLIRCCNILLQQLDSFLERELYLVFDDLHLLETGTLTNNLIEHLLDNSSPRLRFVFLTRHPLEVKGKVIRNGYQISYLNTADLALDNEEIETLYTTIFNKHISLEDASRIHQLTNGWIMGIILASHPISGRSYFWQEHQDLHIPTDHSDSSDPDSNKAGHMLEYFQEEIFAQIPKELHNPFLKFAFFQEISVALANKVSDRENMGQVLTDLARENYFIYHLDKSGQNFRFHHFFQEFLQQQGRLLFSKDEIAELYRQEADYYREKDMLEKALTCYRNAGDFSAMESLLKDRGTELIARNRTITILNLLKSVPQETIFQHNWLTLYAGLMRVDYVPQTTLPFFDAVRDKFKESGEVTGEMLALSQTIYYHFVISGEYRKGATYLRRTEELLEKHSDHFPVAITIMAARNLASGYCFFLGDMAKARRYIKMATTLANRNDSHNFIVSARFVQGYIELLSGNRAKYLREAEQCYALFHDPLVGESNRLTVRVMNLCYLSMTGDHLNFKAQQLGLQQFIDQNVVDQTVAAPYLYVWGSAGLFSLGRTGDALDLLARGTGVTTTAASDHMYSQLLQWQGFGLALQGKTEAAEAKISEAGKLRETAGGPFYLSFTNIIAGAAYIRTGKLKEAAKLLLSGLSIAEEMGSTYLRICALFNLSYLSLQSGDTDGSLEQLETGLSLMKINGFSHFWTWEPEMMRKLLALAVSRDVEKSFALTLARARLQLNFDDEGLPLPLMRFTLLDNFEISMQQKVLFRARDLTPFQREILGLLITAKGQRIPQERIQLELWADSPPDKARKSFDTLLTRLRKLFSPLLPLPIRDYLSMQKGILCLTNYDIDALHFLEAGRTGLTHGRNSDWWQATNAFEYALSLWKGAMPEDAFRSEQVLSFNDTLTNLLTEIAAVWGKHLADSGLIDQAISVLERVVPLNHMEEDLAALLYQLHLRNHAPLKAKETLETYRVALLQAGYSEKEAASFVAELVHSLPKADKGDKGDI